MNGWESPVNRICTWNDPKIPIVTWATRRFLRSSYLVLRFNKLALKPKFFTPATTIIMSRDKFTPQQLMQFGVLHNQSTRALCPRSMIPVSCSHQWHSFDDENGCECQRQRHISLKLCCSLHCASSSQFQLGRNGKNVNMSLSWSQCFMQQIAIAACHCNFGNFHAIRSVDPIMESVHHNALVKTFWVNTAQGMPMAHTWAGKQNFHCDNCWSVWNLGQMLFAFHNVKWKEKQFIDFTSSFRPNCVNFKILSKKVLGLKLSSHAPLGSLGRHFLTKFQLEIGPIFCDWSIKVVCLEVSRSLKPLKPSQRTRRAE